MKQTIISTLLLLLALGCWAQVEKNLAPCIIDAQITDAPNGKTVYLIRKKNRFDGENIANTKCVKGQFKFTVVPETETDTYTIAVENTSGNLLFYTNPGQTTKITGKGKRPSNWMAENACALQKENNMYIDFERENFPKLFELKNRRYYVKDSLYNIKVSKRNVERDRVIEHEIIDAKNSEESKWAVAMIDFMADKPYSKVWLNILQKISKSCIGGNPFDDKEMEKLRKLYEKIPIENLGDENVLEIANNLFPGDIKSGDVIADFVAYDYEGKEHNLTEYCKQGKYTLLEFSGSGCKACAQLIPFLKDFNELNSDKIGVITVNCDRKELWQQKEEKPDWLVLNDHARSLKIMKAYNVVAFPTIFFISPEGKVLGKYPDLKMKVNPIRAIRKYFPFAKMGK